MKLQYRETKWWAGEVPSEESFYVGQGDEMGYFDQASYESALQIALEAFKEIAPQDQEKVTTFIFNNNEIEIPKSINGVISWQPEIGKLYDSGDLVFELKKQYRLKKCLNDRAESNWTFSEYDLKYYDVETREVWVLKEKAKEERLCTYPEECECQPFKGCLKPSEEAKEKFTLKKCEDGIIRIYNSEGHVHVMWPYHAEINALEHLAQLNNDTVKQLQSRIEELEEQRERLIAKLMNAEDKLKELEKEKFQNKAAIKTVKESN